MGVPSSQTTVDIRDHLWRSQADHSKGNLMLSVNHGSWNENILNLVSVDRDMHDLMSFDRDLHDPDVELHESSFLQKWLLLGCRH